VRDYVCEHLRSRDAVLIVDETGDVKKGTRTVGVQRQYTGARRSDRELPSRGLPDLRHQRGARVDRSSPVFAVILDRRRRTPRRGRHRRERPVRDEARAGHRTRPPRHNRRREVPPRRTGHTPALTRLAATVGRNRSHRTLLLRLRADRHRPRARRASMVAHPPQPQHEGTGLLPLLRTQPRRAATPSPSRRNPLAHRRILPSQQRTHRPRPAPSPPLGLPAPLEHPGHARTHIPHQLTGFP
jgi:hypothetical protein